GGTVAQWRTLARLLAGDATVPEVARATGYSRQAIQRLVDDLVASGLAGYSALKADRRTQRVDVTPNGRRTFAAREDAFNLWATEVAQSVSFDRIERVAVELEAIAAALEPGTQTATPGRPP